MYINMPESVFLRKVYHRTRRQTSDISLTVAGNKPVDHLDVVGALPVGAAPTASLFPT